jgi:hypothetical protein
MPGRRFSAYMPMHSPRPLLSSRLRLGLFLLIGVTQSLRATTMELAVSGYVYGGFDVGGTTFNQANGIAYGESINVVFRYETADLGPEIYSQTFGLNNGSKLHDNRYFSPYWYSASQYDSFLGADVTLNGITVAMDTRWRSTIDYNRGWNSLLVNGSANRTPLDPNGGQHNEGVSFAARMNGQLFDPLSPMTLINPNGNIGEGFIRIYEASPAFDDRGYYPEGRFTDGQLHWSEIHFIATAMNLREAAGNPPGGNRVPDSGSTVSCLLLGFVALGCCRRLKSA